MKFKITVLFFVIFLPLTFILYQCHSFYKTPTKRLALDDSYSKMPEDNFHKYINLPINHNNPESELFRGFYILSPNYDKNDQITFILTDGQMELVGTDTDFDFFENILGNSSYVLIGRRGHFPTLFPEVYNRDKTLNYTKALNLYGSKQYIEDIELIRQDLKKKGLLGKSKKINIFGASGAGILAQQYISKYGKNVDRVILQSTGAPDISRKNNQSYSPDFADFNLEGNKILESILKESEINLPRLSNILYQVGRSSKKPKKDQINILNRVKEGSTLFSYYFKPQYNLRLLKQILNSPNSAASKVRYFELIGHDLKKYNAEKKKNINLLYEFSNELLWDFAKKNASEEIAPKNFQINRSSFQYQTLVLSGSKDIVFSIETGEEIAKAYSNSRFIAFDDNHKFSNNNQEFYLNLRKSFLSDGFNSPEFQKILPNTHVKIKKDTKF